MFLANLVSCPNSTRRALSSVQIALAFAYAGAPFVATMLIAARSAPNTGFLFVYPIIGYRCHGVVSILRLCIFLFQIIAAHGLTTINPVEESKYSDTATPSELNQTTGLTRLYRFVMRAS